MDRTVNIGIIGDYNENSPSHKATNRALHHAASQLSIQANITWLPTPSFLTSAGEQRIEQFDGIWASPGSPYHSMAGAIKGIRTAREMELPFIGT